MERLGPRWLLLLGALAVGGLLLVPDVRLLGFGPIAVSLGDLLAAGALFGLAFAAEAELARELAAVSEVESELARSRDELRSIRDGSRAEAAERRLAEEALHESERRLRTLLEAVPLAAVLLDLDARVTFCNEELLRISGWTRDELVGSDWIEAAHPVDDPSGGDAFRRALVEGSLPPHRDATVITRRGERRLIAWSNTILRDGVGRPAGVASIGRDVTDERRMEEALRESEVQYHSLFEENHAVMLLTDPGTGVVVDANPAACAFYGYQRERMLLMKLQDLSAQTERDVFEEMQRASEERRNHFRLRHRLANGDPRDVEVYSGPVTIHGRPVLYWIVFDVTERRRAEEGLRESEQRFRAVFDGAPIGMAWLDTAGRIVEVNPALPRLFRRASQNLVGASIVDVLADEDGADTRGLVEELATGRRSHFEIERRHWRGDGQIFWGRTNLSLVRGAGGLPQFAIAMIEDVTDRKLAEEELTHRALHDPLTGLANRTLFLDRLGVALARRGRGVTEVAVVFLDLDGFKAVNDSLGHEAGDDLLRDAAHRIVSSVRPADTVARFGGDEFVVLCEDITDRVSAEAVAQRIAVALAEPFPLGERLARVSASIGIALTAGPGDEPEALIRDADAAMYAAKQAGRARWEVADRTRRSAGPAALLPPARRADPGAA